MWKKIKKNWKKGIKYVLALLLIGAIVFLFIMNGAKSIPQCLTDKKALENVYYMTQILASMAVIFSALIAVWQYSLTAKAERNKFDNDKIQSAIELAEYYKDNILNRYAFLKEVFDKNGISSYLRNIEVEKMVDFDADELRIIMPQEQVEKIKRILSSTDFNKSVIEIVQKRGIEYNTEIERIIEEKEEELDQKDNEIIRIYFLNEIVNKTLNNVEYFAMNFTHNISSEIVVYSSLSATYIDMIQILYYNIAKNNCNDENRYFTNAIKLFDIWKNRKLEKRKGLRELKRKSIEYGEEAKSV